MPGRRRLWTYSARPVTFSQDSRRGSERPTCGVSAGLSARFMEGAPEIDANQLLLVGRRAVQVAFDLHLLRGGLFKQLLFELPAAKSSFPGSQPGGLVGRGADHHARLANRIPLEIERNRYSHRGPVVGRARGAFEIGRAPAPERRHFEQRDQLVQAKRRFQVAGAEFLHRNAALARSPGNRDAGAERAQHRRQVHVGIGVRKMAAHGRHVADPNVGQRAQRARDHRPALSHDFGFLNRAERSRRTNAQLASRPGPDAREAELAQTHQTRRAQHAHLHHQHQGGAARDRPHRRVLRIERRDRLAQRSRLGQLEWHHVGDILSMLILRQPREDTMFRSLLLCLAACLPLFAHGQTDPIRIGFLTVRSGALAAGGKQMGEGIQLYLKERNYTIAGRKVELIIADTGGNPAGAKTKAQDLVERSRVHVVIGPLAAFEAIAIDDYLRQTRTPTVSCSAAAEDLTQRKLNPWFVRTVGTSAQSNHALGEYAAKTLGYRRVAIIADDFAYGHETAAGFQRVFEDHGGRVVQKLWPPLNVPDYGSYIAQIKPNVDAVYAGFGGANRLRFLKQYQEYGIKQPVLGSMTTADEGILRQMGDEALGVVTGGWYAAGIEIGRAHV